MANKTLSIQQVMSRGTVEGFLPYSLARLINDQLAAQDYEQIRPQMMYQYDRNGLINGVKNQNSVRPYTLEETEKFVAKFVAMRIAKGRKAPQVQTVETLDQQIAQLQMAKAQLELGDEYLTA